MNKDKKLKKDKPVKAGEVNHSLFPKVTSDEIDLEPDNRRDEEIARDKPPHHN